MWRNLARQCCTAVALSCILNLANSCALAQGVLVLSGGTVYTGPDRPPIKNATVVVRGHTISAVGKVGGVKIPSGAQTIDCSGLTVAAGFQNSHVHFLETKWLHPAQISASRLAQQLRDMLTSYGFTTVVDTASDLATTTGIRGRIESGEVPGPRIITAGPPLFPDDGIPYYYSPFSPEMLQHFHQPRSVAEASRAVRNNLAEGADITKLYTGSLVTVSSVKTMSQEAARAAVMETHRRHKLVFAHPSTEAGIRVAIESGVDVLAHTTARRTGSGPWPADLIAEMKRRHVSVIPTLKLWGYEMRKANLGEAVAATLTADGVRQLEGFVKAGGDVLFGTDVGYMAEYDPTEEYILMAQAGMSPMQILRALTVAPAMQFREERKRGRIEPGLQADLVILEGDPASDVHNFARVRYTIRLGRVIYPVMP